MQEKNTFKSLSNESKIEAENLKAYNNSFKGKVEPKNTHHNARKEAVNRKEMQRQQ